jgi:hypothetical protein
MGNPAQGESYDTIGRYFAGEIGLVGLCKKQGNPRIYQSGKA